MKRIKNLRNFVTAIITLILGIICIGIIIFHGMETRFLIAGIFLITWSAVSFFSAFTGESTVSQAEKAIDERDKYIVMKSSRKALQITNYLIGAACFISIFLYAVLRGEIFLTISIALCAVLVTMFIVMLLTNIYYEKRE